MKCHCPPASLSSGRAFEGQVSDTSQILGNRFSGLWVTSGAHPGLERVWRMLTKIIWAWLNLHGQTCEKLTPFQGLTRFGLFTQRGSMARYKCRHHDLQSNHYFFLAYFLWLLAVDSNKRPWAFILKEYATNWEVWRQLTWSNSRVLERSYLLMFWRNCLHHSKHN